MLQGFYPPVSAVRNAINFSRHPDSGSPHITVSSQGQWSATADTETTGPLYISTSFACFTYCLVFCLILALLVHSTSFFPVLFQHKWCAVNSKWDFYLRLDDCYFTLNTTFHGQLGSNTNYQQLKTYMYPLPRQPTTAQLESLSSDFKTFAQLVPQFIPTPLRISPKKYSKESKQN